MLSLEAPSYHGYVSSSSRHFDGCGQSSNGLSYRGCPLEVNDEVSKLPALLLHMAAFSVFSLLNYKSGEM